MNHYLVFGMVFLVFSGCSGQPEPQSTAIQKAVKTETPVCVQPVELWPVDPLEYEKAAQGLAVPRGWEGLKTGRPVLAFRGRPISIVRAWRSNLSIDARDAYARACMESANAIVSGTAVAPQGTGKLCVIRVLQLGWNVASSPVLKRSIAAAYYAEADRIYKRDMTEVKAKAAIQEESNKRPDQPYYDSYGHLLSSHGSPPTTAAHHHLVDWDKEISTVGAVVADPREPPH